MMMIGTVFITPARSMERGGSELHRERTLWLVELSLLES